MTLVCKPALILQSVSIDFGLSDYLPIYFQASRFMSPLHSGIALFGLAFSTTSFSVIGGVSVTLLKKYRLQTWVAWGVAILGTGLLGTVNATTSLAHTVGYQVLAGAGFGTLYSTTYFPVLAPLPLAQNAHALAFVQFLRQFAQVKFASTAA